MNTDDTHKLQTDALVAAIWGRKVFEVPVGPDLREVQNQALSLAIRSYLQSYLDDLLDTAPQSAGRL